MLVALDVGEYILAIRRLKGLKKNTTFTERTKEETIQDIFRVLDTDMDERLNQTDLERFMLVCKYSK
jgi:hypothetical protein